LSKPVRVNSAKKPRTDAGRPRSKRKVVRRLGATWVLFFVGIGTVLIAIAIIVFIVTYRPDIPLSSGASPVGERTSIQPGVHIQPPALGSYSSDPPTSGQHYSIAGQAPIAWGMHTDAIRPEYWVHNLEHGGIAVLYSCPAGCASEQQQIKGLIDSAPPESHFNEVKLVAVPYQVPGHHFALVAWGWRLFLDNWDPDLARRFYENHVDKGPELVP